MNTQHGLARHGTSDNSISCLRLRATSTWPASVGFADDQPVWSDAIRFLCFLCCSRHADWVTGLRGNGTGAGWLPLLFSGLRLILATRLQEISHGSILENRKAVSKSDSFLLCSIRLWQSEPSLNMFIKSCQLHLFIYNMSFYFGLCCMVGQKLIFCSSLQS